MCGFSLRVRCFSPYSFAGLARHDKSSAPATKADIAALMEAIGKLYDATERWKDEILCANERWKDDIIQATGHWKDEIIRRFDVVAENLHRDFLDAFRDRTQQHHDDLAELNRRVRAIENHLGLAV
jgi:hypothetical protein